MKEERRKLRPLVITMNDERKSYIKEMFAHPIMAKHFEPPAFSPGVPQRELRNRMNLLAHAGEAGIIPEHEWKALQSEEAKALLEEDPNTLFDVFEKLNVPVLPGRKGSEFDKSMHYSKELWQKAKGINRGRSVLACSLAHLKAMKTLVEEGYDFILEDNVRVPLIDPMVVADVNKDEIDNFQCECANRIWDTIDSSDEWSVESGQQCELRYYGWLGSRPNLEFILEGHCPKRRYERKNTVDNTKTFFPFPNKHDVEEYLQNQEDAEKQQTSSKTNEEDEEKADDNKDANAVKAGGTPIWGAFAYWISKDGFESLIHSLQQDVGAMLWKGKRMRCYVVKPIDKIIPIRVIAELDEKSEDEGGRHQVHVATHPAFFRAPMLKSQIHAQWDVAFCTSTEYQMQKCCTKNKSNAGAFWNHLWLTTKEREIVAYRNKTGEWITQQHYAENIKNT